jgi:hypothetical protein
MWRHFRSLLLTTIYLTTIYLARVCDLAAQSPTQAQVAHPLGSWCQSGLKWTKPPAELQLNGRSAEAGLLYFGPNGQFALIYGTVIQGRNWEAVSHGDGRVVYLGTWKLDGTVLRVEYRLASRTVQRENETLPGPMQQADIRAEGGFLLFDKMRFHRDRRLGDDLRAINEGERARLSP